MLSSILRAIRTAILIWRESKENPNEYGKKRDSYEGKDLANLWRKAMGLDNQLKLTSESKGPPAFLFCLNDWDRPRQAGESELVSSGLGLESLKYLCNIEV